jgi:phosphomannomutase/phosphoglucomutase
VRATHYQALYPVSDIDGARISFVGGWGLVRASNTGPVLVLRCEAESAVRLAEIRADIEGTLAKIKADLGA